VARLAPDPSGALHLTSGDADARAVLTWAKDDDLRRRMYVALNTVAYPANDGVLRRILTTRAEIARLTGHANWAEWDMVPRMAQTPAAASDFIDRVVAAAGPKAASEYAALLKRKQQDDPAAKQIGAWESSFYTEVLRRERYAFDSQKIREYFPFDRVKKGVLDVGTTLFGVSYRPANGVAVWHPSVEVYELVDNGRVLGRFYLDLHPRQNKVSNGALATLIRKGMAGELTEIALVAPFRSPTAGDPALMSPDEVKQFFHEFGHVVQNILSSQHQWFGTSGTPTERDFNEGPSQLLEEWAMDPKTLATFALHYKTNAPVPAEQIQLIRRAAEFGQGLFVRSQMTFARFTLEVHERDAQRVNAGALIQEIQKQYVPYTFTDETHFESRFTQLVNPNYSASYYTYMWSLVIAKDLFSRFDPANLMAPDVARRYRDTVIVPGASKPAGALIQDFLGRPFNFAAWEAWLNSGG
jgi:thimet oligopeptidase